MAVKQIAAGAVVYDKSIRKFLVLKHRQGHWAFAQGKQERGEELSETLTRELHEETGLEAKSVYGPVCDVSYSFSYRRKKTVKTVSFWAVISSGEVKISSEHHGYLWVTYSQAKKLLSFKNHLDALKAAYKELKKQKVLR